jgi:hypothetical protein
VGARAFEPLPRDSQLMGAPYQRLEGGQHSACSSANAARSGSTMGAVYLPSSTLPTAGVASIQRFAIRPLGFAGGGFVVFPRFDVSLLPPFVTQHLHMLLVAGRAQTSHDPYCHAPASLPLTAERTSRRTHCRTLVGVEAGELLQ